MLRQVVAGAAGLALLLGTIGSVSAADEAKPARKPGAERPARKPGEGGDRAAAMLKRFDKNNDGKLDDAEKADAEKARGSRPARKPGEGRPVPPEVLKQFDKNNDGKLDDAERAEAMKA